MVSRGRDDERDPLVRSDKFELGLTVMTPGARDAIPPMQMMRALRRHARGDWGDLDPDDLRANEDALKHGDRLLSAYRTESGTKFWIITEADRSATTVLLPDEY
ncbi:MAG: hypothetical protein H6832_09270 [Planctomycetes bacterium]|nr:hypothetical protein [Anaerolineae bacterium]MCB9918580.1 hypothetical protein [Planctomycetota bacterium]